MKEKPGPQSSWREALTLLGRKKTGKLPECTFNSDPNTTADYQNQYFVTKINDLLSKLSLSEVPEEKLSFKCNLCDSQFSEEHDLNSHSIAVHDEKECFSCDNCGKNFISEKDLKNHTTSVHISTASKKFEFQFVSADDVTRIVRNLNNTEAIGKDGISTEVLKKGINVLANPIARICNLSLSTGIFPDIFKEAIVHLVFKGSGKNPREPVSYRPISILPSLSKILEKVVRDAL